MCLAIFGFVSSAFAENLAAENRLAQMGESHEHTALAAELALLLQCVNNVIASFEQQVTDARGLLIDKSSGQLFLAKPNFRWKVDAPYPQIIVAKAQYLKIYDPDLEQVIVRSMDNTTLSPSSLLTQNSADLVAQYEISRISIPSDSADAPPLGSQRFTLVTRGAEGHIAQVEIEFVGTEMHTLIFADHTGQRSAVRFSQIQQNQTLKDAVFELELPPDVGIVQG